MTSCLTILLFCSHEAYGTELMGATGLRTTDLDGFSAERPFHIRGRAHPRDATDPC